MSKADPLASDGPRRRSMLPQRTIAKTDQLTNMFAIDEDIAGAAPLTRSKVKQSLKPPEVQSSSSTSMLPPSAIGRSRSTRDRAQVRQSSQRSSNPPSRTSSREGIRRQEIPKPTTKPNQSIDPKKASTINRTSIHRRSISQQVGQPRKSTISMLPSRTPSLRQSSVREIKPAFSTMQQSYSPKKKPNAVVLKQSASPETIPESEAGDMSKLRVELCQLHILHRSAAKIQRQWEDSAKESFHNRFDDLCTRHIELKEIAHQQRTLLNQLALVEWCQGIPSAHIAEKVQQISCNIADIGSLLEPEGKYSHVLEVFESWIARVERIESSRTKDAAATPQRRLTFIEGIGDGWKAEAMVLERELTYSIRELKGFGEIRAVSSLGRILSLHKILVANLLEELDVIQWIENKIMEQEGAWIEQTISNLSSNVSSNI